MKEPDLFHGITKEHVESALRLIDREGYPPARRSSVYDLVAEGIAYPPKYVMSLAGYLRDGNYIRHTQFEGGEDKVSFAYLRNLGFTILPKEKTTGLQRARENAEITGKYVDQKVGSVGSADGLGLWIVKYKQLIVGKRPGVVYNELYKWETVRHFQQNWTDNHTGSTILGVLKKSFNKENNNLWSGQNFFPYAMLLQFAEQDGERVSRMFKNLFDESTPLEKRFNEFYAEAEEALKKGFPGRDIVHYQSDRVLMLYLTLRYPGKYFLYKSKMFKGFCEQTGFWTVPKTKKKETFGKVEEYLKMCEALNKVLVTDAELMELHKRRLPASITFKDNEHMLTQDFIYAVTTYLSEDGDDEAEFLEVVKLHSGRTLSEYFNFLDSLLSHLQISEPDERITFSCKSQQLSFIIGHRYALVLFKDKQSTRFGVMSPKEIDATTSSFEGLPEAFYSRLQASDVETYLPDIKKACTVELDRTERSRDLANNNPFFQKAAFDKSYRDKLFSNRLSMTPSTVSLNQILFGPPGTGKTYHTINEAIRIVDPEYYRLHAQHRDKLRERFNELLIKDWKDTTGQVAFCTFHQSFSYEDFVEGIKPEVTEEKQVVYRIKDGIFKLICRLSEDNRLSAQVKSDRLIGWNEETFQKASFYKMSLGNVNDPDDEAVYEYCIANGCIALGFGAATDFSGLDESGVIAKGKELNLRDYAISALNRFKNYLRVGNYVIVSKGNRYIRAIGRVTGEYGFDANAPGDYYHTRSVEWIIKDKNIPVAEVYNRNLSQQTIYKIDEEGINKNFFVRGASEPAVTIKDKNYVLIIDEINRGNVSSIFGELITLIEKDKRSDGDEPLEVTLPYSKEQFTVPGNVFIVGTMNTADRSIESLDTALRRRFSFTEMPSRPELIKSEGKLKPTGKLGELDLVKMLEKINERIGKLVDKDHKIGHSYFLDVATIEDLRIVFRNKVIPLLEEYFFGDFGKIGLVLGNSFVQKESEKNFGFAEFDGYDDGAVVEDLRNRSIYRIADKDWELEDFKSIYA
ncbi:MAG: AAA family ATPase [Cyclobacteriaceae bacterium]|nr:AAA family ATPase [Cyclobacteriaceae bacterium]